jgi:hypothetical protein
MRRIGIIVFLFSLVFSMNAQVNQEVIATSGGYNVNSNISLSWTLGETIIPTLRSQDGSLILSHGFQQKLLVTAIEETFSDLVKIKVFPNPASDAINIQFDSPVNDEIIVDILDTQGRLLKSDKIEPASLEKQINLQDLPGGIYYFRLSDDKNRNVYKVVKL